MKALVLGGNGFIGSHIVDALLAEGHKVSVFDRSKEHFRLPLTNVEYFLSEFTNIALLAEALEGVDVVYHLISTTVPSTSNLSPSDDIQSNLVGTVRLLDLMVQMKVPRIVFLSSGGTVYGIPETTPIPETHPLNPICSYGIVKIAIENYLYMYQQLYELDYVVIRASNPYGERQGHKGVQGVIGTFLGKTKHNEEIQIWGDGSIVRDYIYIGDLAQFCIKVIHENISGVYNVGSGVGHSISDIINTMENNIEQSFSITKMPSRNYDIPKIILDISKAKNTFDWEPQMGFLQGIKKSWEWCISID